MAEWTEERIEQLKGLWAEGHSATRIAGLMSGLTRNAVLGKVHRLGLSNRRTKVSLRGVATGDGAVVSQSRCRLRPRPRPHSGVPRPRLQVIANPEPAPPVGPQPNPAIWDAAPGEKPVPLLEVKADMCRWPLGDPKGEDFGFCGCPKAPGTSYCADHARLAWKPARRRRRKT